MNPLVKILASYVLYSAKAVKGPYKGMTIEGHGYYETKGSCYIFGCTKPGSGFNDDPAWHKIDERDLTIEAHGYQRK